MLPAFVGRECAVDSLMRLSGVAANSSEKGTFPGLHIEGLSNAAKGNAPRGTRFNVVQSSCLLTARPRILNVRTV